MKITLTGSLGNISKPLAQILISRGHSVTIISSNIERSQDIQAIGAKAAIGKMQDSEFLKTTFEGSDIVYLMEAHNLNVYFDPNLDIELEYNKIAHSYFQSVQQSGVNKIIHLSSIGAHTNEGIGLLSYHHDVENILKRLSYDVSIKFMRPAGFYNNMYGFLETIKTQGAIIQNYGGDQKEPWVSPLDIAEAIAEEIEIPFSGRSVRYIASDEVSPNEIAKVIGNAIGKPNLKWFEVPDEILLEGMTSMGMNSATAKGVIEMNNSRIGGYLYEDYNRNRPILGKVKLIDFATDFASVFNQ